MLKIAKLRFDRAQVLGYATHAHFVLEERMAESPEKVKTFSNDLLEKAKPAALKEFAQLTAFAKELDGIDHLEKWDGAYYSEKLKQKLFSLDDEILKPYFQLEKVLDGAFTVAQKLYGITFEEIYEVDKYHEEVKTYAVKDEDDQLVAVFYADFLVLTMLTPLVALSLLTDEQNYFQIWIKELLSEALTMLIKLILYLLMITLMIAEKYTLPNFMLMVGCGLLIIKTPSALQNMWYSTKVSKGGGLGNLAMMAMFRK